MGDNQGVMDNIIISELAKLNNSLAGIFTELRIIRSQLSKGIVTEAKV